MLLFPSHERTPLGVLQSGEWTLFSVSAFIYEKVVWFVLVYQQLTSAPLHPTAVACFYASFKELSSKVQ